MKHGVDSFDVHYSKICWKLQERYICRFVCFYWVYFDRCCPLLNIVKFLKYFRNISWNISWNISGQINSWNFTSLYRARQKVAVYNLLLISPQRLKLILEYFVRMLNVYISIYFPTFISVRLVMKKLLYIKCSYMKIFEHLKLS